MTSKWVSKLKKIQSDAEWGSPAVNDTGNVALIHFWRQLHPLCCIHLARIQIGHQCLHSTHRSNMVLLRTNHNGRFLHMASFSVRKLQPDHSLKMHPCPSCLPRGRRFSSQTQLAHGSMLGSKPIRAGLHRSGIHEIWGLGPVIQLLQPQHGWAFYVLVI